MIKKILSKVNVILAIIILLCGCQQSEGETLGSTSEQEIIVLAAASLTDALQDIKQEFEQRFDGISILYSFGSSGNLVSQIEYGAPADLFIAASSLDMDALQKKDLLVEESRINLVSNQLVLIASKKSSQNIVSFTELQPDSITQLAIGNPESVPVGRYAQEVFEHLAVWDKLQSKLVYASDVRQVLTYVETGNVDMGVVYMSDALRSPHVQIVATAESGWHSPIDYPVALLRHAEQKEASQAFLTFLASPEGKKILAEYGFSPY